MVKKRQNKIINLPDHWDTDPQVYEIGKINLTEKNYKFCKIIKIYFSLNLSTYMYHKNISRIFFYVYCFKLFYKVYSCENYL